MQKLINRTKPIETLMAIQAARKKNVKDVHTLPEHSSLPKNNTYMADIRKTFGTLQLKRPTQEVLDELDAEEAACD